MPFIDSQYSYDPLPWMFYGRLLDITSKNESTRNLRKWESERLPFKINWSSDVR